MRDVDFMGTLQIGDLLSELSVPNQTTMFTRNPAFATSGTYMYALSGHSCSAQAADCGYMSILPKNGQVIDGFLQ